MKRRATALVITLLVVAAVAAGYLYSRGAGRTGVATAEATTATLEVSARASGTLEAPSSRAVFAPVAGRLVSVAVRDGDAVKKGAVLGRLDDTPLRLAVAQADAHVAAAVAMPTGTDRLNTARQRAIDAAVDARAAARADVRRAKLTAPIGGVVRFEPLSITRLDGTGPTATPGAMVSPAMPVFTIVDSSNLRFVAQVDEADVARVERGQTVSVALDAFPGREFTGRVSSLGSTAVTTSTGGVAFPARIRLDAEGQRLFSGMSGDASISVDKVSDALVVPVQAIVTDGADQVVYRIDGDVAHRVVVQVGTTTDAQTQITSGLSAGDRVAITNLTSLRDGGRVDVQS